MIEFFISMITNSLIMVASNSGQGSKNHVYVQVHYWVSAFLEICLSFFRNGKWNDVFVDRKIPVKLGQKSSLPKYAKWVNPHDKKAGLLAVHDFDWWCPLLEKAYAKINGGYDKIATGCAQAVLEGLTGGHALVTNANNLDCDRLADYCKNYLCTAGNEPHINCNANEFRIVFKIS